MIEYLSHLVENGNEDEQKWAENRLYSLQGVHYEFIDRKPCKVNFINKEEVNLMRLILSAVSMKMMGKNNNSVYSHSPCKWRQMIEPDKDRYPGYEFKEGSSQVIGIKSVYKFLLSSCGFYVDVVIDEEKNLISVTFNNKII